MGYHTYFYTYHSDKQKEWTLAVVSQEILNYKRAIKAYKRELTDGEIKAEFESILDYVNDGTNMVTISEELDRKIQEPGYNWKDYRKDIIKHHEEIISKLKENPSIRTLTDLDIQLVSLDNGKSYLIYKNKIYEQSYRNNHKVFPRYVGQVFTNVEDVLDIAKEYFSATSIESFPDFWENMMRQFFNDNPDTVCTVYLYVSKKYSRTINETS